MRRGKIIESISTLWRLLNNSLHKFPNTATQSYGAWQLYLCASGFHKYYGSDYTKLGEPFLVAADCIPLCEQRCKLHSRKRVCMRACTTCCDRCKCVPPGTYGNRERCGKCYTNMTTHGNRIKCPWRRLQILWSPAYQSHRCPTMEQCRS